MPQVNDLGALALQNAAHDIDGCIVPVEQGGCRYDPYFLFGCKTHGVVIVFWYRAAVQVPASLASHSCTVAILSAGIVNRKQQANRGIKLRIKPSKKAVVVTTSCER
jgi:hypothetical protein